MTTTTISLQRDVTTTLVMQRALIVEDQREISELLAQILQPLGFETKIAANGSEALLLAQTLHPDLITLDLNLPVKDGHAVLQELAANPHTRTIPVIVISAYTGRLRPTDQVVGVLQKPFDLQELVDTVVGACIGACVGG